MTPLFTTMVQALIAGCSDNHRQVSPFTAMLQRKTPEIIATINEAEAPLHLMILATTAKHNGVAGVF